MSVFWSGTIGRFAVSRDLSTLSSPLGNFLHTPKTREAWKQFELNDEQISYFNEQGYLAGIQVLDDRQLDQLHTELGRLMQKSHPANDLFYEFHSNESRDTSTALFHALGAWRIEPGFHDVLWSPAVTVAAAQLLGGPVRLWHDQLFCKPAQHGGVVAWHQDYSYWTRTSPMAHLTCWIALDDSTRENGCLYYVPGSHNWNLLPVTGLTGNMDDIMSVLSPEQKAAFHPVPIELKRGQCTFHHPLMVHGSYANRSDRQRRATVVNMFRDGIQSATDDELLVGVPRIPKGQPMGGQFYPILLDPNQL
jgi:ectoine hydroxylase-related dioxygenase (phytanoyl-CoA dioxygenase family)